VEIPVLFQLEVAGNPLIRGKICSLPENWFRRVGAFFLQTGLVASNVLTPRCSSHNVVITPQVVVS